MTLHDDPYGLDLLAESEQDAARRLAGPQSADERLLEELLRRKAWFPYRRMTDPVERTHAFVHAFNATAAALLPKMTELSRSRSITQRLHGKKAGLYLKREELLAPWAEHYTDAYGQERVRLSRRWAHWTAARRSADKRFAAYEDYAAGALHGALKRGWSAVPSLVQLTCDKLLGTGPGADRFEDATIRGYTQKLYADGLRLTTDPHFQAAAWAGAPEQAAYLGFVAQQIVARSGAGARAERAWAAYQRDGRIAASVTLADALSFVI